MLADFLNYFTVKLNNNSETMHVRCHVAAKLLASLSVKEF